MFVLNPYWIRRVEIPDDALVYVEWKKYKADKFILHERVRIGNVDASNIHMMYQACSNKDQYLAIKYNGLMIEHLENQTDEMCLAAINQNYQAIQYIKEQTEEMCLKAVSQNWRALEYVKNQTDEMCLNAISQNWCALDYVKNQTDEICSKAISYSGGGDQMCQKSNRGIVFKSRRRKLDSN